MLNRRFLAVVDATTEGRSDREVVPQAHSRVAGFYLIRLAWRAGGGGIQRAHWDSKTWMLLTGRIVQELDEIGVCVEVVQERPVQPASQTSGGVANA